MKIILLFAIIPRSRMFFKNQKTPVKHFLFYLACLYSLAALGQSADKSYERNNLMHQYWQMLKQSGLSLAEVQQIALHVPVPTVTDNSETTLAQYQECWKSWMINYPEEWKQLEATIEKKNNWNLSWVYFMAELPVPRYKLYDTFYDLIYESGITRERVVAVAPHFPFPNTEPDYFKNDTTSESTIKSWIKNFPKEFTDVIQTPEFERVANESLLKYGITSKSIDPMLLVHGPRETAHHIGDDEGKNEEPGTVSPQPVK